MEKELPVFEKWPYRMPDMEKAEKQIREFARRMENAKDEAEALKIWKANAKLSDKLNNEMYFKAMEAASQAIANAIIADQDAGKLVAN